MTFKEFQISLVRDAVLGRMLPMECKKTFPRFEVVGNNLYASFLGIRMTMVDGTVEATAPIYYLKIAYPHNRVKTFVRFNADQQSHPMTNRDAAQLTQLVELGDRILKLRDEKSDELAKVVDEYNTLLHQVLEEDQIAVLDKMDSL